MQSYIKNLQDKLKKWLCRWFVIKMPVTIHDCHRRNNMKEKKYLYSCLRRLPMR